MTKTSRVTLFSLIFFNDELDDDLIDYPTDEADGETYDDNSYAIASACLSDNLQSPIRANSTTKSEGGYC